MNTYPETISVQDLQRHYRAALDRTRTTRKPLYVLKSNKAEAVIIDMQSWKNIVERLETKELKKAMHAIGAYRKEQKSGKLKVLKGDLADLM